MKNKIFNEDLIIHSQEVKGVGYVYESDNELDIDECKLTYKILKHKENERDFRIRLLLNIENFKMVVEGHYEINSKIEKEEEKTNLIEFAGLSSLIPFLRYSVLTITSVTSDGAINLPLIDMKQLISDHIEEQNKEKKEKKKSSKAKSQDKKSSASTKKTSSKNGLNRQTKGNKV